MRRLLYSVLAAALVGCGASAQEMDPKRASCTVELNGDSVLFGFQISESWRLPVSPADRLRKYGYTVTDKTAGGLTTRDLVTGYTTPFEGAWTEIYPNGPQHAFKDESHDSRVVVIQTGINDARKADFRTEQIYHDYRELVQTIRAHGRTPVIAGVTQVDSSIVDKDTLWRLEQARKTVKRVAQEMQVHYASFDAVPVAWTDGIHLDQDSSNGIAENLRVVLGVVCGI